MEKRDIKNILEELPAENHSEQQVRMAKLWLFQLNNKDRATLPEYELDSSKAEVWQRLEERLASDSRRVNLWPRIVAVAAAIALMVLGLYFFNYNRGSQNKDPLLAANDIVPGKVGATLTLANGQRIRLTAAMSGELATEAGVVITKSAEGQLVYEIKETEGETDRMNTLSTAKGETYQVRLPDSSLVWLNAASSLTYPVNLFRDGKRRVRLDGEGYFEIAKDQKHPFVVESKSQQIEVLGTHFNVNAYTDERVIRTTLLEGSVKIIQDEQSKQIKPGEQAMNAGSSITISQADTEFAIAWKNNKFIFDSQRIEDIMRMIARWYNVEVIYTTKIPKETFWGSISRFDNVSRVLEKLESTEKVHFKVQGRKIYVSN
jgi:transmembrane sensor